MKKWAASLSASAGASAAAAESGSLPPASLSSAAMPQGRGARPCSRSGCCAGARWNASASAAIPAAPGFRPASMSGLAFGAAVLVVVAAVVVVGLAARLHLGQHAAEQPGARAEQALDRAAREIAAGAAGLDDQHGRIGDAAEQRRVGEAQHRR